jgi:hypothetical protein
MERFSWQAHFRNRYTIRRDWHTILISGTIKVGWFRRFFVAPNSIVEAGPAPSNSAPGDAGNSVSKANQMQWSGIIRQWQRQRVGLCVLLCLLAGASAIAQTETSTPSAKSTPTSTAPLPQAKPSTTTHAPGHTTSKPTTKHKTSASKPGTHPASAHPSARKSKTAHGKTVAKKHGQQAIDSDRARQIQTALIREHYMQGEPSGTWDNATQAAMQRYQADQGWQSKTTPDARALIKLGLGPSSDHLLNPESAMTTSSSPAAGGPKPTTKSAPPENNIPQQ